MPMKKTMAAILSAAMLCTSSLATTVPKALAQEAPMAVEQQTHLSIVSSKMKVLEVNRKDNDSSWLTVQPLEGQNSQAIRLNLSLDTFFLDNKTGLAATVEDLKVNQEIYAYYSAAMTRSIPPQAAAYALVLNLDAKSTPAHYLVAEQVTQNDDQSVTVLAEQGTILVTIAKDTPITPYLTKEVVNNTDIQPGTRFFAWYNQVALSMPGQAHATKAVILPAESMDQPSTPQEETPLQPGETTPYRYGIQATITQVNVTQDDDMLFVSSISAKTEGDKEQEIVFNLSTNPLVLDTKTGLPAYAADLEKGQQIYVYYDAAMTASEPAQVSAEAILVNLDKDHAPAHLLTAEQVTQNPNGSITLLGDNGSVLVTVGQDKKITPYRSRNTVKNTDIRMGSKLFAWYDVVAESYPSQASATKVVLLPTEDCELTMISQGDIAIGQAKIQDSVVMVPLRQVAETLGFTVTWHPAERSVHLTNNIRQATVTLGVDSYNYSSAQPGLIGMSAPTSLGAAAYELEGTTWIPAEFFNLLVEGNPISLHGDVLYI